MNTENHYQETDLGNISLNPRGEYNPEESYEYLDLVVLEGGSYVCIAENGTTITGISPESGKTTQYWQVITIPGSLTPEYITMHDRVVNLSEQVGADAEEVRTAEQNVSGMELNVTQMQEQTRQSAEAAEQSKDSSAGYAASANASRQAAEESEQNINAHITGFDIHVVEKTEEAENDIEAARIAANKAIIAQQEQSVNEVARAGIEAISTSQSAAQTATEKAQAADTSEKNAAASETAAKLSEANATKMAEQVAADKEQVANDRTAVENAKQEMTGSVAQIEQNTQGISELKSDLSEIDDINGLDVTWIEGAYVTKYGTLYPNEEYKYTDYISLYRDRLFIPIAYKTKIFRNTTVSLYDKNKNFISAISPDSDTLIEVEGEITRETGAYFIRVTSRIGYAATIKVGHVSNLYVTHKLGKNEVTTDTLSDASVTTDKLACATHDTTTNFINIAKCEKGYISATGEEKPDPYLYRTHKIPMQSGDVFYYHGLHNGYYAFYADDGSVIEAHGNDATLTNPLTIPDGTAYARFSFHMSIIDNVWLFTENAKPEAYRFALDLRGIEIVTDDIKEIPTEYAGCDISAFTRCICIGDSLTAGTMNYKDETGSTGNYISYEKYAFPAALARMTGIEVVNKGLGGNSSAEWYNAMQNEDLSGFDIAIIQLGVNDAFRYSGWTQTSIAAFTNIINKLKTENKNIKIFVSTIIPATSYMNDTLKAISQGIRDFVTGLNDADVILLDMAAYGHTAEDSAYNCGHLSAYGYWRLAADYKAYISWYMNNNKHVFREIQFIGTEYSYT